MRLQRTIPALLAGAALTLGACGGDDGGDKLSKADFIAQVDKICADAEKQGNALKQPTTAADFGPFIDMSRPIIQKEIDDLHGYESKAPDEVKDDYVKAVDMLDKSLPIFDEFKAAGTDEAKIQAVSDKLDAQTKDGDALARKIGLQECGKDDS